MSNTVKLLVFVNKLLTLDAVPSLFIVKYLFALMVHRDHVCSALIVVGFQWSLILTIT